MDELDKKALDCANALIEGRRTVREVAKIVGYSKSSVHNYLTQRLPDINKVLYQEVREVLEYNKKIRHIRGGEATKLRYQQGLQF